MPAVPFARFTEEVLALYAPPLRRKATYLKMRQVLGEFAALQPRPKKTSDIGPALMTRWLAAYREKRKPITSASLLISFRAACNIARKMGWLRVTPWDIRKDWISADDCADDDDAPGAIRHHSIEDLLRVLDRAALEAAEGGWEPARLQALVATYIYTGLRKKEALGLQRPDVDLGARIIKVKSRRRRKLKTRASAAPVGVPDELAPILDVWLRRAGSDWVFPNKSGTGFWNEGRPGKKPLDQVKALGQRAGVAGLTIQSFRHSLATHAGRFGLGPLALKAQLRHTSLGTQEHYIESDLANIRAIASQIRFRAGS
jgi:integrase